MAEEESASPKQKRRTITVGTTNLLKAMNKALTSRVGDTFNGMYKSDDVIRPRYNPIQLALLTEKSETLGTCITAMATNVTSFGWELTRAEHLDKGKDLPKEAVTEKQELEMLLNFINPEQNISLLRYDLTVDYEFTGRAFVECVRNNKATIQELHRLPSVYVRMTHKEKEPLEYTQKIRDHSGKHVNRVTHKRFRRFVQELGGNKKVWFKEFGDPRKLNWETGKYDKETPDDKEASEVMMFMQPSAYDPYGQPRWIGQLLGIIGSRKAAEVNFLFFDNNTIPPLVVSVAGGSLTEESIDMLEKLFDSRKGVANFHKGIIIEATPQSVGTIEGEKVAPVRIDIKPLTDHMQKDGLFQEYMKENAAKLQASFRLLDIAVGKSKDYNRATSETAIRTMEDQVFGPERSRFDYLFNRLILSDLEINNWTFKTLGAKTSDLTDVIKAMASIKEAIPLGFLIEMAYKLNNTPVPEDVIDEEIWNIPLGMIQSAMDPLAPINDKQEKGTAETVKKILEFRDKLIKSIKKEAA